MKPPKGPAGQMVGAAPNSYGIWQFARNKEAGMEFLRYYADNCAPRRREEEAVM